MSRLGFPRAKSKAEMAKEQAEKAKAEADERERKAWVELLTRLKAEEEELKEELKRQQAIEQQLQQAIEDKLDMNDAQMNALKAEGQRGLEEQKAQIEILHQRRHALRDEADAHEEAANRCDENACVTLEDEVEVQKKIRENDERTAAVSQHLERKKALRTEALEDLQKLQAEETLKQDSTYGVSEDVARIVKATEKARVSMEELEQRSREIEMERRMKFNKYEELKGTIRVYCRVKGGETTAKLTYPNDPSMNFSNNAGDGPQGIEIVHSRSNATSTGTKETPHPFSFDRVYTPSATQREIFEDVGPLVDCAVDGFKVCIMAYGQTGSGKTYTMEGVNDSTAAEIGPSSSAGIIPRSIVKVFERAKGLAKEGWTYKMSCYFI